LFSFITAKLVHEPDKIVEARPGRQGKVSRWLNDLLGTVPAHPDAALASTRVVSDTPAELLTRWWFRFLENAFTRTRACECYRGSSGT
jgi:hypothetical protein